MASFLGNIGNIGSGYFAGRDQLLQRQLMQQQLQDEQQKRQGLAALAQSMGNQQQVQQDQAPPQMPIPPQGSQQQQQAPQPGQQSIPMQPPQAAQQMGPQLPPSRFNVSGNPGAFRAQLERIPDPARRAQALQAFDQKFGGAPGVPILPNVQQGPKPYTEPQPPQQPPMGGPNAPQMPAPPATQAVQGLIQSKLPSLEEMSSTLQKQGITGMPLFYALQQHQNFLSQEGKQQLAQLTEQVRMLSAQASMKRADTGQAGEQRREATAEGANAQGAAKIELEKAQAEAARARANMTAASSGKEPLSKETIDFYAKQSLAGDNSWQVGLARGKVGQQLIAAVKDRIPQLAMEQGVSPEEASANKSERASLDKALVDRQKYLSVATQFVGNFQKQADLVERYLKPGAAGGVPAMNKWIQAGRKATGDADVSALDTAIRGLAREHQRIVTGVTSNAQLHASAQTTADELLNTAQTPEQIRKVLGVMREEAKNAVDAGRAEVDSLKKQIGGGGKGPKKGDVEDGYRFKGGDPANAKNWEKA